MGTFAKRIGQLMARSVESESSNIIKTISANKSGLSKALDTTLRTSHDMKVFGLGTAASMASLPRYARFTSSMHAVYSAMETSMDDCKSTAVQHTWSEFSEQLRRAAALSADLDEAQVLARGLSVTTDVDNISPATRSYVAAIRAAAKSDDETGGARLLGHLFCRYVSSDQQLKLRPLERPLHLHTPVSARSTHDPHFFRFAPLHHQSADLFGGQALAGPYRWALGLGPTSPRHYDFGEFGRERRQSIEQIYSSLNAAGEMLGSDAQREAVVDEAKTAFRHNVLVYREDGRLVADGALGMTKMIGGFVRSRLAT